MHSRPAPPSPRPRWTRPQRDTWGRLLRLGWPVSLTMLVRVAMRTTDVLVVGAVVGASGVAALGIGDAAARVLLMTALGLGAGTIATVSQAVGAGRTGDADVAVTQSVLLATAVAVPFTIFGWTAADDYFRWLGADGDVAAMGATYLAIVLSSAVPRALAIVLTRALHGAGDTRTPLRIRSVGTGVNILLTVVLVGGVGPAPALGVAGAAWATVSGNTVSAAWLLTVLARRRRVIGFTRAGMWAPHVARRIWSTGWPQIVDRNIYALAAIPLNALVLTFGTAANAGLHVGRRVQLFALLPAQGVATAASTYMGQFIGARRPADGQRHAIAAGWLAALITASAAVLMAVAAEPIRPCSCGSPRPCRWRRRGSGCTPWPPSCGPSTRSCGARCKAPV